MSELAFHLQPVHRIVCPDCGATLDIGGLPVLSPSSCPHCGGTYTVPGRLDRYLITDLLGTGAMGAVFGGQDVELERDVAIKMLFPPEDPRMAEAFREQFLREARGLAALDHPHIVRIHTTGTCEGQPYMVMDWLVGGSLKERLRANGPLPAADVLRLGLAMTQALRAAWSIHLLHGDVKPDNILYNAEGQAVLADFGLVASRQEAAETEKIQGSMPWLAPEKIRKQPFDFRADLYSLGCTLFQALTHEPPFPGASLDKIAKKHLAGPPDPLRYPKDTPPGLRDLLQGLMAVDPDRRPASHDALLDALAAELERLENGPGGGKRLAWTWIVAPAALLLGLASWKLAPNRAGGTVPPAVQAEQALNGPLLVADTHVQGGDGSEGFFGSEDNLWIKHHPEEGERTARRILLRVRFPAGTDPAKIELRLTYAQRGINSRGTYYAKLSLLPETGDWTDNPLAPRGRHMTWTQAAERMKAGPRVELGRVELPHIGQAGETLVFSRATAPEPFAWDRFWRRDQAVDATLLLEVQPDARQRAGWKFASREHRSLPGPLLVLETKP